MTPVLVRQRPSLRLTILLIVFFAVATFIFFDMRNEAKSIEKNEMAHESALSRNQFSTHKPTVRPPSGEKLRPDIVDIFVPRDWELPAKKHPQAPPVLVPVQPAAALQAPKLPFRLLGKIVDSDQKYSFALIRGNEMLMVHIGDHIGETYLIEDFDGVRLYFKYLPLNIRQSLLIANPNG